MAQILQLLRSYVNPPSYASLSKKDEDLGIEQAQSWVTKYPINDAQIQQWEFKKVESYAQNLLKELKSFPITSANKELVERHLVAACKSNSTMRVIIKTEVDMRGSQMEIKEIRHTLIYTYGR